jgi:hypothetical protein
MQNSQISAKGLKYFSPTSRGRAPTKVEHDRNPVEAVGADSREKQRSIIRQEIGALPQASTNRVVMVGMVDLTTQTSLDPGLTLGGQLRPVRSKHLDAIVRWWIVARRNHQTACRSELADQQRHGRGRTQTQIPHLTPSGGEASG